MIVLDACAIIAYLRNEEGAGVVEAAFLNDECTVHSINLCEVYKDCLVRGEDSSIADQLVDDLIAIGLITMNDMDEDFWKHAAVLKAKNRISLADSFALALTKRLGGTLYSSDHHELDPIAVSGEYLIEFIR